MELDLEVAAKLVRDGANKAVWETMNARRRRSPYETTECHMKITTFYEIREWVSRQGGGPPPLRVFDELKISEIGNLPVATREPDYPDINHPFDLVVGYPLMNHSETWERVAAYGLVELKRNSGKLREDAIALGSILRTVRNEPITGGYDRGLRWVLLVVLVNGTSSEIATNFQKQTQISAQSGLRLLCGGGQAQNANPEDSEGVIHTHFDILCYGDVV